MSASLFSMAVAAEGQCSSSMVAREMEAAEALAEMTHLAIRDDGVGTSHGKWGSKGKRGRKRVKSMSPPPDDSESNPLDLELRCSDLVPRCSKPSDRVQWSVTKKHGPVGASVQQHEEAKQDTDFLKPSPTCTTRSPPLFSCGRPKQNLTEAEKEARRVRRVLANRESARQTIRRRQVMCEELNQKAADLAWENKNLKREKELALKEFLSLESLNKHLKAQMTYAKNTEGEESPKALKSTRVEISAAPSTNCPFLLYNHRSFTPLNWPSIIQSSNPGESHHVPQNAIVLPSNAPINLNGQDTPLYILPYPWLFSHPGRGNGVHRQPSSSLKNNQDETSVSNCSASSTTVAHVENSHSSSTEGRPSTDSNNTSFEFPPDTIGQQTGPHPKEMVLTPALKSFAGPAFIVPHENGLQSDHAHNVEPTLSMAIHTVNAMPEKNKKPVTCSTKKIADTVVAAAEARRRRKELTRLKRGRNLQD